MAKVLQRLARRGLLTSHQGTRGGYRLGRASSLISVAEIIQAIDGPLTVTGGSTGVERCGHDAKCSVRDPLWRLKDRIVAALVTCSLQGIATDPPLEEKKTPLVTPQRALWHARFISIITRRLPSTLQCSTRCCPTLPSSSGMRRASSMRSDGPPRKRSSARVVRSPR